MGQYLIMLFAVVTSFVIELVPVAFIIWYFYNRNKMKTQPQVIKCKDCAYHNNGTGECKNIHKRIQGYNTYTVNEDFCMYGEPHK